MASPNIVAVTLTICTLLLFEKFDETLEYQILGSKNFVKEKYVWNQQPLLHVQFKTFVKRLGHQNFMAKHKRSKRQVPNETAMIRRNFTKIVYQMPMPMYPPAPVTMVPMRTVYQPVIHDHPPLHKIQKMIESDERRYGKRRWRPKNYSGSSSSSVSEEAISTSGNSCSTGTSDSDESAIDYYDNVDIRENNKL